MNKNEYYGFIYITINNINGKKYIGQKKYDKEGKWKTYLGSGIILNRAIKKYGAENFSKEIIEKCYSKKELDKREIYWINFYDAVNSENFYNIASGGDGGNTIAGYTEEQLNNYKQWKSELHKKKKKTAPKGENAPCAKLSEKEVLRIIDRLKNNDFNVDIAKDYNVSIGTIDDIRHHKTWCYLTKDIEFDDISSRKRPYLKRVYQYDLEGNLINIYDSARDAERKTGISYKQISQVCNGNKRMSHEYIWRFEGDAFDKYTTELIHQIKIDQYDKNGVFIKTYNSKKEIENILGIRVDSVINGRCHSAGGYYWCKHGVVFTIPEYKHEYRKLN